MMQEIDNTNNNLILGFAVFSFKVLAVLSMHEGLDLALTCLSIVSVILLIVINFKKAWNVIFKPKTKEDEN
jgi:hypothetical protein|tara:strand:+ start:160 stop:372 length:213 start_codon:yes stop_codon:yes gene_type:complete